MRSTIRLLAVAVVGLLAGAVRAQGFASNCTATSLGWDGDWTTMFIAECLDSGGNKRSSFISVDDCVANQEGALIPQKSGSAFWTCARCSLTQKTNLTCLCARSWGQPATATLDMNSVMKNMDGIIGCFDFPGVEISSMKSAPA